MFSKSENCSFQNINFYFCVKTWKQRSPRTPRDLRWIQAFKNPLATVWLSETRILKNCAWILGYFSLVLFFLWALNVSAGWAFLQLDNKVQSNFIHGEFHWRYQTTKQCYLYYHTCLWARFNLLSVQVLIQIWFIFIFLSVKASVINWLPLS